MSSSLGQEGRELLCLSLFRGTSELQSLLYGPRMNEKRETLFEDRTHCHADYIHAGHTSQDTTAAVGVLKGVHFGEERSVHNTCSVCVQ